jgi:hypothetical protein
MNRVSNPDGTVTVTFNPCDTEDCGRALVGIMAAMCASIGPALACSLFSHVLGSGRKQQEMKNIELLQVYVGSGLNVKKFAAWAAKKNESRIPLARLGPTGSTDPQTLEKQIRRLKNDPKYRECIKECELNRERELEQFKQFIQSKGPAELEQLNAELEQLEQFTQSNRPADEQVLELFKQFIQSKRAADI